MYIETNLATGCPRFYLYCQAPATTFILTPATVGLDAGRRDVWSTSTQIRCKSVGYMNVWSQQGCPAGGRAGGRRARGVGNRRPRSGRHQRQPLLWHDEPPTATTAASPSALQQSVISNHVISNHVISNQYLTSYVVDVSDLWKRSILTTNSIKLFIINNQL